MWSNQKNVECERVENIVGKRQREKKKKKKEEAWKSAFFLFPAFFFKYPKARYHIMW